jgi:vanillate O-demethylase ferredoxin subunit
VQVSQKEEVAEGIFAFTFESLAVRNLTGKIAGAHIDVHLPSGVVRQYSLTGLRRHDANKLSIAVLRDENGRGGSRLTSRLR